VSSENFSSLPDTVGETDLASLAPAPGGDVDEDREFSGIATSTSQGKALREP
jgi:hypothetical protein